MVVQSFARRGSCPCTEGAWGRWLCHQGYALLTFGVQSFASLHTKGVTFGVQWSIILLTNQWFVNNMMHRFAYKSEICKQNQQERPSEGAQKVCYLKLKKPCPKGQLPLHRRCMGQVAMRCSPLVCRALHRFAYKSLICKQNQQGYATK